MKFDSGSRMFADVDIYGLLKGDGINPLNLGTTATTGHTLGAGDVLIGGKLEVDGTAYFDAAVIFGTSIGVWANSYFADDVQVSFGTSSNSKLLHETADDNANELILALSDGGGTNVPVFVIGTQGIINNDLGWFNGVTGARSAWVDDDDDSYLTVGASNTDDMFELTLGGNAVALVNGGASAYTPDAITATGETVAASIATVYTLITTNGDTDEDDVSLADGVQGQIKVFSIISGNAGDSVKITPAKMIGGTQITFAADPEGLGCIMMFDATADGWVVVGNNGGTIA